MGLRDSPKKTRLVPAGGPEAPNLRPRSRREIRRRVKRTRRRRRRARESLGRWASEVRREREREISTRADPLVASSWSDMDRYAVA